MVFDRIFTLPGLLMMASALVAGVADGKSNPVVLLSTTLGDIKIELYPDKAPLTVQNFLEYVKAGYYNGTIFHRVIPGFMIQGGGLSADMQDKREGQRAAIKNESGNGLRNDTGTVAMARMPAADSATSQFFINVKDNTFLNKESAQDKVGYAVFGRVTGGMDVVRKIEQVKTTSKGGHRDVPVDAVAITAAKVLSE
jgi:cyclophilin family peptidyl-prolyl cis-trans isomerase